MSAASCFNLDHSKILSSGNGLKSCLQLLFNFDKSEILSFDIEAMDLSVTKPRNNLPNDIIHIVIRY